MKKQYNQLPHVAFSILVALTDKERHGYDIVKQIYEDSQGRVRLSSGALYASIQQLAEKGLIHEVRRPDDSRRRYYALTSAGEEALHIELDYYKNSVRLAEERQKEKYA